MKVRLASAVLAVSALACGAALAQDKTLVINSFGGAYEEAHRQCIITPFEQETGAKVSITTAYSADAFAQLRAQKEAPQYDVIHFSGGQEIVGAAEGLLAPIDAAKVPNMGDLYDFAKANVAKGEGPAYSIAAIGLLYNSERSPKAPSSWKDLTDPAFSEHLVITDISNGYGMLGFLMLNRVLGGDLGNIQPGLDAVAKLLEAGAIVVSKSAQECFANALRYSPTNAKAELAPEVAADTAYGEAGVKGLIRFDPGTVEANRASWVEQWNKTIAR